VHGDDVDTAGARHVVLREVSDLDGRAEVLAVLEGAGWARSALEAWAGRGTVLELFDPADEAVCAAAIVESIAYGTFSLRAWAMTVDGIDAVGAERLVRGIADALRRAGARRVVACVGDAQPQLLAPLVAAGFRFAEVERDAGATVIGRPCDRSRDLVWMDQDL
jgi:hypothetical protein